MISNADVIVISISIAVIFIFFLYVVYKKFNSIELSYFYCFNLLTVISLSILPGAAYVQKYVIILLFVMNSLLFISQYNPKPDLNKLSASSKLSFDNKLILVFLLFFFASVIINIKDVLDIYGFSKVSVLLLAPIFYCLYLPEVLFRNKLFIKIIMKFFIVLGVFTGIIGLVFYALGINSNPNFSFASLAYFRHPNTVAFVYSFSSAVSLYYFLFERNNISQISKVVLPFAIIVIYAGMLFTFSRAGYLSLAVSTFLLIYYYNKKVLLYIIIFVAVISSFLIKSFVLAKGAGSSVSRLGLLYSAVEMLKSSRIGFLFGFGSSSVFNVFQEFKFQLGPLLEDISYPHNFILFYIMQFGVISFVLLLFYLLRLILFYYKKLNSDFENYKFYLLPFVIVISLFFQSLLEDTILFPEFFVFNMFLTFLGFLIYGRSQILKGGIVN